MPLFDVAVVGAGAAGLMSAIQAKTAGAGEVLLLDTRTKIGAKILISGGTRCNVTNKKVTPSDYKGGTPHFIKHVLSAFPAEETRDFFKDLGVELVLEPSGKYFPTTHSGKTVLEALVRRGERLGIHLKTPVRIIRIRKEGKIFVLFDESQKRYEAKTVILATGGLSMPETGSDGMGYSLAKEFGHTLVETSPSLTPLLTDDVVWQGLSGLSLEVELSFFSGEKKMASAKGSFLFTHFGFSGPVVLDISRYWIRAKKKDEPRILANFIPQQTEAFWHERLIEFSQDRPQTHIKSFLTAEAALPDRFADAFLGKLGADGSLPVRKIKRAELNRLIHELMHFPLKVTGDMGYKKAEVTAGGIDLLEVEHATMRSKKIPGLYFAGEILDVDGRIGGFNFQWAWSSGTVAGRAAAKAAKAS